MGFILVASAAFLGTVAVEGVMEIGAEIGASWNGEWANHYFWDVDTDENGSESQRLAAALIARVPDGEGYKELCALPMAPKPTVRLTQ